MFLYSYNVRGAVWIILYLFFVLAPMFALLTGSLPPARDFWTEFSAAIGYAGLAIMGLQFGLTARFRYVTEPWDEDVIYHFHRQILLLGVGLVMAHLLVPWCPKTRLWFVKTLDTFDSFELSDLEKAQELSERWCNNVTSAAHFERDGIFADHKVISFHGLLP